MKSPLRQIRERTGQTLVEVGHAVSVDAGNLSRVESGKQAASIDLAARLARHFKNEISEMEILYPDRYVLSTEA